MAKFISKENLETAWNAIKEYIDNKYSNLVQYIDNKVGNSNSGSGSSNSPFYEYEINIPHTFTNTYSYNDDSEKFRRLFGCYNSGKADFSGDIPLIKIIHRHGDYSDVAVVVAPCFRFEEDNDSDYISENIYFKYYDACTDKEMYISLNLSNKRITIRTVDKDS